MESRFKPLIQLAAILIIYTVCIKFFGFIYPMPFFLFAMIEALATKEKRPKLIVAACVAVIVRFSEQYRGFPEDWESL